MGKMIKVSGRKEKGKKYYFSISKISQDYVEKARFLAYVKEGKARTRGKNVTRKTRMQTRAAQPYHRPVPGHHFFINFFFFSSFEKQKAGHKLTNDFLCAVDNCFSLHRAGKKRRIDCKW